MAFNQATGHQTSNVVIGPVAESSQYIQIQDEKATNTQGGTFTSGAWRTRTLNTIDTDETGQVSVSSSQFTLPAGTYRTLARAPGYRCGSHATRLRNITDGTTTLIGSSEHSAIAPSFGEATDVTTSDLSGTFSITASKDF
jgi:hypothetical protein